MFNTIDTKDLSHSSDRDQYLLVDLRSKKEFQRDGISGSMHIPYHLLCENLSDLPVDKHIVLICNDGTMAGAARNYIMGSTGLVGVYALERGIGNLYQRLSGKKAS